ncbi:MAG: RdgB/HAM1 family non-canonical purine NTP pyrophosphatase [Aquificota bacterium]|nr:MAG: RdgB/HAM1 family non-canonical purine NTP pyrophosphatase [Aquificota bacterium]
MLRVLLATTNKGKAKEIIEFLEPFGVEVLLPERELQVEETGTSFLENAYLKAKAYQKAYGMPTLAEDSGLVVPALGGYPGVYSSRFYSLEWGGVEPIQEGKDKANINKLLRLMEKVEDRRAYFVSFFVLDFGDGGLWSEGRCYGHILHKPVGEGGFGYDPVFAPEGYDKSMAQLSLEEKNRISHRGKALKRLLELLK